MNIVLDNGLNLNEDYQKALEPLLPAGQTPLRLSSWEYDVDGTIDDNEVIVFLTDLPNNDVKRHHAEFFERYKSVPRWFFIVVNDEKSDNGCDALSNAARRAHLNCTYPFHVSNTESFSTTIAKIVNESKVIKGKTLLLTKHNHRGWISDLAKLLYGENNANYEIASVNNLSETDAEFLLICGENINDFIGIVIPENVEPYFVFRLNKDVQTYINPNKLIDKVSGWYHNMTSDRVAARLYFVDIETERWLYNQDKPIGKDAIDSGILLWDSHGLPLSRNEYTKGNIAIVADENHEKFEELKKILL